MSQIIQDRFLRFCILPEFHQHVFEVQSTTKDGRDWLTAMIKAGKDEWPNTQHRIIDGFAKSSLCGVSNCENFVEVGAHCTLDGKQLIIVPMCKRHTSSGALAKLPTKESTLKPFQIVAEILLKPGDIIDEGYENSFTLVKVLPFIEDFK